MTHLYVANLEIVKEQRCSRIGDTSAPIESVELFKSETACGVAEQSAKERNVKSSRVVPAEHLCAGKRVVDKTTFWNPLKRQMGYGSIKLKKVT